MSAFKYEKKLLIEKVFEKAKKESLKTAKTSIAKYLEIYFLEDLKFNLSYKSFERYHDFFVLEKNLAYPVDKERLDMLSVYLGYKGFSEFLSERQKAEEPRSALLIKEERGTVSKDVKHKKGKNKSSYYFISLGIVGGLLLMGLNFSNLSVETKEETTVSLPKEKRDSIRKTLSNTPLQIVKNNPSKTYVPESKLTPPQFVTQIITQREKECMFWNEDHFEKVYCDEKFQGSITEAFDDNKFLLKKIKMPDTLATENALGKVWYDKTNKKVEFFTHHGVHPENGKTLKAVTKHILETYCKK